MAATNGEKAFKRVNLLIGAKKGDLESPFGYAKETDVDVANNSDSKKKREILLQQSWNTATSGVSSIGMNAFMFWMMGSGVHIFTLIFMFTMLYNSIKTISNVSLVFKKFESLKEAIWLHKLIYAAINSVPLLIGLYKLYGMGLLPLHPSDYVALVPKHRVSCLLT